MNKLLATATIVAMMTAPASAQYMSQQQVNDLMDGLTARNLIMDSGACTVSVSDEARLYSQTIIASNDFEVVAWKLSEYLKRNCDQLDAFFQRNGVLERIEFEAKVMNHPVIVQQNEQYNAIIRDAQQRVLQMLDEADD